MIFICCKRGPYWFVKYIHNLSLQTKYFKDSFCFNMIYYQDIAAGMHIFDQRTE